MSKLNVIAALLAFVLAIPAASAAENPFLGRWAVTPDSGGAGWLGVEKAGGVLEGSLLWQGGSPVPQSRVWVDGDTLYCLQLRNEDVRDASGAVTKTLVHPRLLTATVSGDEMTGVLTQPSRSGENVSKSEFTAKRIPELPPKPDLATVRFGEPISLFDGKSLDGWTLIGNAANGWSVEDGVLSNDPAQKPGQPHIHYGNLRTVREDFEDFNITFDVNVPAGGNSGVYLRGIYEVQMADSFGRPLDCHNMGAIYGRITPTVAAEKPPGTWQSLDVTLVDRHATVKLNGQTIIDNQPIVGCTGGALWSDEFRPGPIYLQGDHMAVKYRNIVLRPVLP